MVTRSAFDELMKKNRERAKKLAEHFKLLGSLYGNLGIDSASQKP